MVFMKGYVEFLFLDLSWGTPFSILQLSGISCLDQSYQIAALCFSICSRLRRRIIICLIKQLD